MMKRVVATDLIRGEIEVWSDGHAHAFAPLSTVRDLEERLAALRDAATAVYGCFNTVGNVYKGTIFLSLPGAETERRLHALGDVLNNARTDGAPEVWEDGDDEWTEAVNAAFPTRSGAHDEYATAMRMVGKRQSKGVLVGLVTWLLVRICKSESALNAMREAAYHALIVCEDSDSLGLRELREAVRWEDWKRENGWNDSVSSEAHQACAWIEKSLSGQFHELSCAAPLVGVEARCKTCGAMCGVMVGQ